MKSLLLAGAGHMLMGKIVSLTRLIPSDPNIDETPTPSYNLVDLFATYDVNENFSTSLTLNNIFDEQYRIHRHEEPEPGFNAKLSAIIRFGG